MMRPGIALLVVASAVAGALSQPASPPAQGLTTYRGLVHAHTSYSDGLGTPEEAFTAAKASGLDFFAVTPHNHSKAESGAKGKRRDGVLVATNHDLYDSDQPVSHTRKWKDGTTESVTAKSVISAASGATSSDFVAIYGQEFSTISSGNHVNVFGVGHVLDLPNGDFKDLVDHLETQPKYGGQSIVVQMNHPDVHGDLFYGGSDPDTKKKMDNDYGIDDADYGPQFSNLVAALDPNVTLIEVLSGPAMKTARVEPYSYSTLEDDYYFYLTQGLHVGPTAGQDNHYETWGTVTDACTGVLASARTLDAIMEGLALSRTFASEDRTLDVRLSGNGEIMGSNLTLDPEADLALKVDVVDPDEANTSVDVIFVFGTVEAANRDQATEWRLDDGAEDPVQVTLGSDGKGTHTKEYLAPGTPAFFFVKVVEEDNDRAWTAPIWINHPRGKVQYVWTKSTSSHWYHLPGCWAAANIKPANRMSGSVPPQGRELHSCNVGDDEGGH